MRLHFGFQEKTRPPRGSTAAGRVSGKSIAEEQGPTTLAQLWRNAGTAFRSSGNPDRNSLVVINHPPGC